MLTKVQTFPSSLTEELKASRRKQRMKLQHCENHCENEVVGYNDILIQPLAFGLLFLICKKNNIDIAIAS